MLFHCPAKFPTIVEIFQGNGFFAPIVFLTGLVIEPANSEPSKREFLVASPCMSGIAVRDHCLTSAQITGESFGEFELHGVYPISFF